jgi:hypothetical protein
VKESSALCASICFSVTYFSQNHYVTSRSNVSIRNSVGTFVPAFSSSGALINGQCNDNDAADATILARMDALRRESMDSSIRKCLGEQNALHANAITARHIFVTFQ